MQTFASTPALPLSLTSATRTLSTAEIQAEYVLIRAAQQHMRRFGVLYERYYEAIFRFIYKRVAEEDLTSDLTAQVFEKAMLNLKHYRFQGVPFSAWLYRIAINEVNQHFRRSQRQRVISMERVQIGELFEEIEAPHDDDALHRMLAAIQTLSDAEVQFLELRFFEGLPFREIAAIYHITENNAKVRMHRLLHKLKQRMTL